MANRRNVEAEVFGAVGVILVTSLVFLCCRLCKRRQREYRQTAKALLESKSTAQQQEWHKSKKLREAVSAFHHRFARVPERLDEVRRRHTELIDKLLNHLREKGIPVHPEYVGSAYEGVKVAASEENDDLEFDVLVTMKLPNEWTVHVQDVPGIAGHVFLSLSNYDAPGWKRTFYDNIVTTERSFWGRDRFFIDGRKVIDKFFGELQNWIKVTDCFTENILLRRHGPAVQMDVCTFDDSIPGVNYDRPCYTVDVVPALEIMVSGKKLLYVAKPVKTRVMPDPLAWRPLSSTETEFSQSDNDGQIYRFTPTHAKYMLEIEKHLGYTLRSAGYKIGTNDNNLVFKELVIDDSKRNQIEVSEIEDKPDFFRLNLGIGQIKERLNSRKETTTLVGILQQVITSSELLNGKVHIRREGPIVRLIVCETEEGNIFSFQLIRRKPLFYVDMILAYRVGGRLYVARPSEDRYTNEIENSKAWRLSYSVQAKNALYGQYGCMKMVLRVLKALRNQEVALAPLTSYHLKTVVLWLIHKDVVSFSDAYDINWSERCLGERLMDTLLKLEKCLKEKNLPHRFLHKVNLTSHMVEDCINSMGCRLHILCTNEQEMMRVLHAPT